MTTSPRAARRDLVMAVAAFWTIAALAFTVGRWFVPGFSISGVVGSLDGVGGAPPVELRAARVFDLQTAMGGLEPAAAAMDASGALDGRHTFAHLDGFEVTPTDAAGSPWECDLESDLPETGCRYEVKIRVRDDQGTVLLVSGKGLTPDGETASGFSVTVSAPGITFNSKPGQCTLGLTAADVTVARLAGWVECVGLTELRSGVTLDLLAAFDAAL